MSYFYEFSRILLILVQPCEVFISSVDSIANTLYAGLPPATEKGHCAFCILPRDIDFSEYVFVLTSVNHVLLDWEWQRAGIFEESKKINENGTDATDYQIKRLAVTKFPKEAVDNFSALLHDIEKLGKKVGVVIGGGWAEAGTTEAVCTDMFKVHPFAQHVIGRCPSRGFYDPEYIKIQDEDLEQKFIAQLKNESSKFSEWLKGHPASAFVWIKDNRGSGDEIESEKIVRLNFAEFTPDIQRKALEIVQQQL